MAVAEGFKIMNPLAEAAVKLALKNKPAFRQR